MLPRQHFEQQDTERPDIGARIDFLGVERLEFDVSRELNVSPSQRGEVRKKREGSRIDAARLPREVRRMAGELGYE